MPEPTLTVLYSERTGALDRIISLLRRRGFPIAGITVERTHQPDVGRMTVVVQGADAVQQVTRHLQRLPDVLSVVSIGERESVRREYALARVRCTAQQRPEVMALLAACEARALSVTDGHLVVEASGDSAALDTLLSELAPYGIEESARTSPIALHRTTPQGDGVPVST